MPRRNHPIKHTRFAGQAPCARKQAYQSEDTANKALDNAELMSTHLDLASYKCPYCSKWHLTSATRH